MADVKWSAAGAAETLLSTGLNSLATAGLAVSAADDNNSDLELLADFELYVSGFGASINQGTEVAQLFLVATIDGTTYPDGGGGSVDPDVQHLVGRFVKRTANGSGAVRMHVYGVSLPPRAFKIVLKNVSGQTLAASSNTLKMSKYHLASA